MFISIWIILASFHLPGSFSCPFNCQAKAEVINWFNIDIVIKSKFCLILPPSHLECASQQTTFTPLATTFYSHPLSSLAPAFTHTWFFSLKHLCHFETFMSTFMVNVYMDEIIRWKILYEIAWMKSVRLIYQAISKLLYHTPHGWRKRPKNRNISWNDQVPQHNLTSRNISLFLRWFHPVD